MAVGAGALVGNALMPGLGGAILGGLIGSLLDVSNNSTSAKTRVFVSFDFDNDQALKHFVLGQTKHPGQRFSVTNMSLNEAAPEAEWEKKARAAIRQTDLVLVMIGEKTHRAQGVLKEVRMAREERVKVAQMIGYPNQRCHPVPGAGRVYTWTAENLSRLFG